MPESSNELRAHFNPKGELYELRHQLARVMNNKEWKTYSKIAGDFDAKRRYTERAFQLDRNLRFQETRKRLIDEAGSVKRQFTPKFFGADNFDKNDINRRAKAQVIDAHKKDMARIDRDETEVLRTMLETCEKRAFKREEVKRDFQKSVDRRSGYERRQRSWSR
ncbi:hypothetical protein [Ruegeria conchae]|uniref:Uncharacterized protein n=1 Tax=Ruegeria conchae TaxID=981384 RepID=A0A497YZZ4_9RHOB|nr:hypothetical protein [Ruegeria conchae]RLK00688.1 hypothetical protein CLV75_3681 [Ruegeria conchae]